LELLFGWLKGIWAIGRWEEPKSPETPRWFFLDFFLLLLDCFDPDILTSGPRYFADYAEE